MHVHVHGAGNARQLRLNLSRQARNWRARWERSDHLHVDRRGQSEVENLADDVGGLEEEVEVGKLAVQARAQLADIIASVGRGRPARSETRMSPSKGPMVAVSLMARLRPE